MRIERKPAERAANRERRAGFFRNGRGAARAGCALFSFLLAVVSACGDGDTVGPETRDEIVLFGYLYPGETISEENALLLSRTAPVLDPYDLESEVVTGAIVTLRKEGSDETDTLSMVRPGYYAAPEVVVESRTTYHLRVEIAGEEPITASTTTPWPFELLREPVALPDSMRHDAIADSFPIYLTCENEEQIFLVDSYCLEEWEDARWIDPFGPEEGPEDYQEYGGDNGEPRHIAPYFRVKGLEREGDAYRIGWYGDLMAFYGTYDVQVLSIDENVYRWLYKDHPELNGGVTGALGLFGSACRAGWRVRVTE